MDGILGDLVKEFRNGILTRRGFVIKAGALGLSAAATAALATEVEAQQVRSPGETIGAMIASGGWEVVDMSVTTAHGHPTNWPTDPLFAQIPMAAFGGITASTGFTVAGSAIVNVNRYELTAHTGTQIDFPPHFLPPPGVTIQGVTGNEFGAKTGDQFEMKALMGPAVVLDVRAVLAANTENGKSAHVTREWVEKWEAKYGQFQPGEVPLLFSGYSDMYYQPFPNGDRFQDRMLWAPLVAKSAPGWAALEPDALNLIADRGVMHLATDGPSFGYTEDGRPPHVAASQRGMSWGETVVNMGSLPVRGAFYVFAPYKVEKQEAGIGRAFAIRPSGVETVGSTEPLVL